MSVKFRLSSCLNSLNFRQKSPIRNRGYNEHAVDKLSFGT